MTNYKEMWESLKSILITTSRDPKTPQENKYVIKTILKIMEGIEGLEKGTIVSYKER